MKRCIKQISFILAWLLILFHAVLAFDMRTDAAANSYKLKDFVGYWSSNTYLELYICKDGTFETIDYEAGNPGIKGTLKIKSDTEIAVNCTNDWDFDSYFGIKKKDTLTYSFDKKGRLIVSYPKKKKLGKITFTRNSESAGKSIMKGATRPKFKSIQAKGKSIKLHVTAEEYNLSAYEVAYKVKGGKWKIIRKKVTYGDWKYTIKNLKKGKYDVKVRGYYKLGDKEYYSKWVEAKPVRVK